MNLADNLHNQQPVRRARQLKDIYECIVYLIVKQYLSVKQTDGGCLTPLGIFSYRIPLISVPRSLFNFDVPNAPFLYPLKTSENLAVFECFQEVEQGCIGNERLKRAALIGGRRLKEGGTEI